MYENNVFKMKIAVNTRTLIKNSMDGIGNFVFESFRRIVINHPEHEFYFIFDRAYDPEFIFAPNVTPIVIGPPTRHPFLYFIWFEISIPRVLKKVKADLFISPDGMLSLRSKVKSMCVIHDINFEFYPNDLPFFYRKYYRYFFPKFANKAIRISTVSAYSKSTIVDLYNINNQKVDIIYNACRDKFQPLHKKQIQLIRDEFSKGKPYFLFLSSLQPRKNLLNLLRAFEQYRSSNKSEVKLLIVGKNQWVKKDLLNFYNCMKFKEDVIFTGRVEDDDVHSILAAALALFYISYFEGFGVPVIEGFCSGIPVVCSNSTALDEVAGEAAYKVDPFSVNEIELAMKNIDTDEALRSSLIRKGHQRKLDFSLDKTAELLWESINKII